MSQQKSIPPVSPVYRSSRMLSVQIFISFAFLLIGVVIGLMLGWHSSSLGTEVASHTSPNEQLASDEAYQAGFDAARERLVEQGIIDENGPSATDTIFGQVVDIQSSEVVVEVNPSDPLADYKLYTVAINDETRLQTATPLSLEEFDAALIEYEIAVNESESGTEEPSMPEPFEFSTLQQDDIQIGDAVMVQTAETFERGEKEYLEAVVFQKRVSAETAAESLLGNE